MTHPRTAGFYFSLIALLSACSAAAPGQNSDRTLEGTGGDASVTGTGGSLASGGSASGGLESSGGAATGGTTASGGGDGTGGVVINIPDWPDAPNEEAAVWIRARNLCPFPLWIRAAGAEGTLTPTDQKLETDEVVNLKSPALWTAARVTAFADGPGQGEIEKAEMTVGNGVLNYNVTYVDWVGLPMEIVGVGAGCNAAEHTTGCYAQEAEINDGCPHEFLRDGKRCLSARSYCLNAEHQGEAYCKALDAPMNACPTCPKSNTPEIYACSGAYAEEPRLCAALNRGISQSPDDDNPDNFYKNPPYNTYAKWVHEVCPDIYAFSYDDWQSHGGFRACSGNELRITFCPNR